MTISANNQTKVYGAALPVLTAAYAGLVNGDTAAVVTGLTLTTIATAGSGVGSDPVTAGGATVSNYATTLVPGALTVTPAPLTVMANSLAKGYGAALPALTAGYLGLVNGDTAAVVTGLTLATTATPGSGVGNYPITSAGASAVNYAVTFVPGTLAVTPAPLTVTSTTLSKVYGAAVPALTATYTGLVNGDTAAVVTGLVLTTTATAASGVGRYPITPGGGGTANYALRLVPGTLTVNAAPLTVTVTNQTKVFGAAVPTLTYTAAGFVNGDTAAVVLGAPATAATATSLVGAYAITRGTLTSANYTLTVTNGTLSVSAAPTTTATTVVTATYNKAAQTLTLTGPSRARRRRSAAARLPLPSAVSGPSRRVSSRPAPRAPRSPCPPGRP